eukprot:TRINITY_DN16288_c1_g1_i1.p1 TRINITY_DN16288_c1_g1~~TRINITY_DN16288_c1_g1_i1.p1  ORF type:complete len:448 (+),score=76.54 TRINITY_DN16288_c1_g1_i1:60-1346(+)
MLAAARSFFSAVRGSREEEEEGGPRKKAVVIGINYIGTRNKLGGCINDARNHTSVLEERFGFPSNCIKVLTDDTDDAALQPTKANICEAISWLLDGARPGDILFFSYSGHGTQFPDETREESDGMDEGICPLDCNEAPWPEKLILDDELHGFWCRVPAGANLVCIFDCCHSGSIGDLSVNADDRAFGAHDRSLSSDGEDDIQKAKSRFLEPPLHFRNKLMGRRKKKMITQHAERAGFQGQMWILSGCDDHQTSSDAFIENQRQGALSWAVLKSLREASYEISCDELLANTREYLRDGGYSQTPQMTSTHRELLRQRWMCPEGSADHAQESTGNADGGTEDAAASSPSPLPPREDDDLNLSLQEPLEGYQEEVHFESHTFTTGKRRREEYSCTTSMKVSRISTFNGDGDSMPEDLFDRKGDDEDDFFGE